MNFSVKDFMVELKRNKNSYKAAFDKAKETLRGQDPKVIVDFTGVEFLKIESVFRVRSLGQDLLVTYPEGDVFFAENKKPPLLPWRLITINYLGRADGRSLTGIPIGFRELEAGNVYYGAFEREAIKKPAAFFQDKNPDIIKKAIILLGGELTEGADVAGIFYIFPNFPVTIKLWLADEEFPGSANLFFDSSANGYLHTEDVAAAGEMIPHLLKKAYQFLEG